MFGKKMSPLSTLAFSISLICLVVGFVEAKDPPQAIRIFQDESPAIEGLSVRVSLDKTRKSDTQTLYFILSVANLFSDEIFLGVTGFDEVSFSLEEHTATADRVMSSGSGSGEVLFPDNTQLLKRLHAALGTKDNKTITCACCAASIPIRISMNQDNGFSEWAGISGVLKIPIRGFFRSSGKEFSERATISFIVPENLKQK